jgi:hypothetical protein
MATEVDIANRALSKLGEARIISLDDNNKPARAMKARLSLLRDAELEAYAWRFAVKRTTLAASTEVPSWGYGAVYERPVDDLRPLMVNGGYVDFRTIGVQYEDSGFQRKHVPYEIIEGKIHTDLPAPLQYEYVARITNTGAFSALFVEALAARLAADAAEELTQSRGKKEDAAREYEATMKQARRVNALYNPPRRKSASSWFMSRGW